MKYYNFPSGIKGKEVMFWPALVCLSVRLFVNSIKMFWTDFDEIVRVDRKLANLELIRFWW